MIDPLAPLLADGVIDEVLSRLKSGKEADIYLVRHGGEVLAAKVYKERLVRSFQNNAAYKEGRAVRNTRTQRAMDKGSRFGRGAEEDAWKTKESEVLQTLFDAGVRVPRPHLFYEGVLLMEVVLDAEGRPAPRLIDVAIPRERAAALYRDLLRQVIRMLHGELIHGDLSAYNVLLGASGPTIIDFPQVVGAAHNSQAELFFRRDLEGLHQFFARIDPALQQGAGDAREIRRAYVRRELTLDFVPSGRPPPVNELAAHRRPPPGPRPHHRPKPADPRKPPGQPESGRRSRRGGNGHHATTPVPKAAPRPTVGPQVSYRGQEPSLGAAGSSLKPGERGQPGERPSGERGQSAAEHARQQPRQSAGGQPGAAGPHDPKKRRRRWRRGRGPKPVPPGFKV